MPKARPTQRRTRDAGKILDRLVDTRSLRRRVEQAQLSLGVAQMIYDARTAAGLSQGELARLIGTTQSVISRLEDSDYAGHSLTMLQRIAQALHRRIEIRLVPDVA